MKISIIIPVYNAIKYFDETVKSVLNQTYKDWELILIDDGSTDGSDRICDQYAVIDDRIKVFHQANSGVSAARNKGISLATGEWIEFLDSDDYIEKNFLEEMINYTDNTELIVCSVRNIPQNTVMSLTEKRYSGLLDTADEFEDLYNNSFYNLPTNKLYKKDAIIELFDEEISLGEDLLFNLQFMRNCNSITVISKPLYNYRVLTENSLSKKVRVDIVEIWKKMIIAVCDAFKGNPNVMKIVFERFVDTMTYKYLMLAKNKTYKFSCKIKMMHAWYDKDLYKYCYANRLNYKLKIAWWLICKKRFFLVYLISKLYNP